MVLKGKYSSYIFADHASSLIHDHAANSSKQPLFLYLPFQDTHGPLQAPKKFIDMYPNVKNEARRKFSGSFDLPMQLFPQGNEVSKRID